MGKFFLFTLIILPVNYLCHGLFGLLIIHALFLLISMACSVYEIYKTLFYLIHRYL
jgi:hypothetical protein